MLGGGGGELEAEEECSSPKSPAKLLLKERGAPGITQYLEEQPQSARRIQDEMRELSMLGGAGGELEVEEE